MSISNGGIFAVCDKIYKKPPEALTSGGARREKKEGVTGFAPSLGELEGAEPASNGI